MSLPPVSGVKAEGETVIVADAIVIAAAEVAAVDAMIVEKAVDAADVTADVTAENVAALVTAESAESERIAMTPPR